MKRALIWIAQVPAAAGALMLWPLIDWVGLAPLTTAILLLVGVVTAVCSFAATRRAASVIPAVILVGLLLLFSLIDLSPVQPATRAVRQVRPGMLEAEVRAILRAEFPDGGRFHPPGLDRAVANDMLSFVLNPNDGAYDAAVIQVQFADGRAVSASFLPD